MKKLISIIFAGFLTLSLIALTACSGVKDYAVLLWSIPEHNLQDTQIVPVYIKSNIMHVYVIGIPGTEEKIEVPFWQISEPQSYRKAKETLNQFMEFKGQYASVKTDGLPIREETVNMSRQIYRLRKNQTIKILYKGEGESPTVGGKPLEGEWLRVLTQDGTSGWCFSHNLLQFEYDENGNAVGETVEEVQKEDNVIQTWIAKRWYPEYYVDMIKDDQIDPENMNSSWGLDTGSDSGIVKFAMQEISQQWQYNGVTRNFDGTYKFNDIPLLITVKGEDSIVARYTDESGKPQDFNLVTLTENIDSLVSNENARRDNEFAKIRSINFENPGLLHSSNYGNLTIDMNKRFTWTGYDLLIPSIISNGAGNSGTVSIKYFIGNSLKRTFDGVLTFKFDNLNREVNFLYKIDGNSLQLTDARRAEFKDNVVRRVNSSSLMLYFSGQ